MSVDVVETIVIERPLTEVAGYAGDPSNVAHWCRRIDTAEWQTDPPTKLGSQINFAARVLGRKLVRRSTVTEFTPGEQVAIHTPDNMFPIDTTSTWRAVGGRVTHMTLRHHVEPQRFSRLTAPLVAIALRRTMRRDLNDLKRLLESRS